MFFEVLTYNQSEYVFQTLESIKYQVLTYGKDEENSLFVFDDASEDDTYDRVLFWISNNRCLFADSGANKNSHNIGTVQNTISAINLAGNNAFQMIAGDDIFSYRSCYEVIPSEGVLFSPILPFEGNRIKTEIDFVEWKRLLLSYNTQRVVSYVRNALRFRNPILAPGVFYQPGFFSVNEGMLESISRWKYTEDLPTWDYYFNYVDSPKVSLDVYPRVLYRHNSGISTSSHNEKHNEYEAERERIGKVFYSGINDKRVSVQIDYLFDRACNFTLKRFGNLSKIVKEQNEILYVEAQNNEDYLATIVRNADIVEEGFARASRMA